jgi:hypothetical protein
MAIAPWMAAIALVLVRMSAGGYTYEKMLK